MPSEYPSPVDFSKIEAELREALEVAQRAYREAKSDAAKSHQITEDVGGLNNSDGRAAVFNATRSENHALSRYKEALKAFNDFVLDRKVPRS
jgi:hypothetical protein